MHANADDFHLTASATPAALLPQTMNVKKEAPRRLAWIGSPSMGGVGGLTRLFVRELARAGVALDVYSQNETSELEEFAGGRSSSRRFFAYPHSWNWNSWYGRNPKAAFAVSFAKRLRSYRRLVDQLVREHRVRPYDAVVQFSQGELFALGRYAREIPIILFPCVHAAGERYWCRAEEALAAQCEPWWWRRVRDFYLSYRAGLQRRDYHKARGVIGMSRRFNRWVEKDYKVPAEKMGVVYHPIETAMPALEKAASNAVRRIRLLFVGRISVRKGLESLLEILPALLNEEPEIEVTIIGGGSLWSNYEALLKDLPGNRCSWIKALPNDQVMMEMQRSDLLLIPSSYEPGGIVVGEALASGMVIVASDEVGSAENLPPSVCHEFRARDRAGFHGAIRRALADVRVRGPELREEARRTAQEQFNPSRMAGLLLSECQRILGNGSAK